MNKASKETKSYSNMIRSKKYVLEGHSKAVESLLKLENDEIASGSWDKSIIIWDFYEKRKVLN